jgi:Kef-type K+ transport system membrane component KefB/CBS domain-containing protein
VVVVPLRIPEGTRLNESHLVFSLGLLLMISLIAGQFAYWLRLPRVTAYLLVGLVMGPHVSGLVPEVHLRLLHPLGEMAMALVLFSMGCHFSLTFFRRIMRRAAWFSLGELSVTFTLVTCGILLIGQPWTVAVLLGVLALATAPATTMLVLKENDSEGPVTEYTIALVALNNLAAVVLFESVLVVILLLGPGAAQTPGQQFVQLFLDIVISLLLGGFAGLVVSYACDVVSRTRWLVLLVAVATLLMGICDAVEVPYLLTFLAMGATVANASERAKTIEEELGRIAGVLCVVFFVIHGADLDVRALGAAGLVGVAYIVTRSVGKYTGILIGGGRSAPQDLRRWLGLALLSQAGAAIALSSIAAERAPELGNQLKTVILGTVVFFEIVGPLLIRQALLGAGEVPLDKAIHHTATTPWLAARRMWNRLLAALGLDPWRARSAADLTVRDLMRKNYEFIEASAEFDALLGVLERSHDNIFPVTEVGGQLHGVIDYEDLRNAVFDPNLGPLVRAADLARPPGQLLSEDAAIGEAWLLLRNSSYDFLPVVSADAAHRLVGVVARRDLYRFFLGRSQKDGH